MNVVKCRNGHFYDFDKYITCPHCAREDSNTLEAEQAGDSVDTAEAAVEVEMDNSTYVPEQQNPEHETETSIDDGAVEICAAAEEPVVHKETSVPIIKSVCGWLVVVSGAQRGMSFNIYTGQNSIGRGRNNDIVLMRDDKVSEDKHAWLTYEPKKRRFFIRPGESSGLTYINDDTVMEPIELKAGDVIEVGDTLLRFVPLCGEDFSWDL